MITWQVVQAQLPPQACSSGTPKCLATSRNDSGLPWCEYGSCAVLELDGLRFAVDDEGDFRHIVFRQA